MARHLTAEPAAPALPRGRGRTYPLQETAIGMASAVSGKLGGAATGKVTYPSPRSAASAANRSPSGRT